MGLPRTPLPPEPSEEEGLLRTKVRIFLGCVAKTGAERICNAALNVVFSVSSGAGTALSSATCNALKQVYVTGTVELSGVISAAGSAYVQKKLGALGKLWEAAETAWDLYSCLDDSDFF